MKFKCSKCGFIFEGPAEKCPHCGATFKKSAVARANEVKPAVMKEKPKIEVPVANKVKAKKPVYKKWWFWLIIGLVTVGTVGAICGFSQMQTTEYKMNDAVKVGNLECTVVSAYNTKKTGPLGTETQNNYVVVNTTVKNTGTSKITLYSSNFSYYRGNNMYEPSSQGFFLPSNGFFAFKDLGAGNIENISFVFEIPSEYQATDYFQPKFSFHSEKIYMK